MRKKIERGILGTLKILPFAGILLQLLRIRSAPAEQCPTMGVSLNKLKKFDLIYNDEFVEKLSEDERVAVMIHEYYHLTHRHVTWGLRYPVKDRPILNIAMDMCINQLIKNLPKGAVYPETFNLPTNQSMEWYFEKLKQNADQNNGELKDKDGNTWSKTLDEHDWEEIEKAGEEALKEHRDLMQRAINKAVMSHTDVPGSVKDLINEMDTELRSLDFKYILGQAIRKSLPSSKRMSTWKRPNKRYGSLAKGSKSDESPKIDVYLDTSGSISVDEFNTYLKTNDQFLKYANKKCTLNFFHTTVYHTEKYKVGKNIDRSEIECGGTDLQDVMVKINKDKPDLAVVFTDGYYGNVTINKMDIPVVFVISTGGQTDHPLKNLGTTVKMNA